MTQTTLIAGLLVLTTTVFAASGTTYCPKASDFHIDNAQQQLVAPGGWRLPLQNTSQMHFYSVIAVQNLHDTNSFVISHCVYNSKYNMSLVTASSNKTYVVDESNNHYWRPTSAHEKICYDQDPQQCTFHRQ